MSGTQQSPGIIPLVIENIFNSIENTPERAFLLRASYMEIYQENIYDLLTGVRIPTVREDVSGQVIVPGLKEICVINEKMLLAVMSDGDKRRKVGETHMNERSSRSHSIFRLIIESRERGDKDCEGAITVSHLNLVDLAGSENVSQTGAVGERLKEGGSINKSLFMLGRVISQLSDGEQYVNFRDSKLTRILQNSLGGNAKTAIVCTVTPVSKEQTLSTVRFASRAKSIKNKPIINEVLSESALLKRYAVEIKKLKMALENERNTDKAQEVEQVKEKLDEQEKQNLELQEKLNALKERLVVSSHPLELGLSKDFKNRRKTWAASALSKPRRSAFNLSPHKHSSGLKILPLPPFSSLSSLMEESTSTSDTPSSANDTVCSFESNADYKEDLLKAGELSKLEGLEDSFLSPQVIPKRRRRKHVMFDNLPKAYVDVEIQTDESLLPKPVLLEQTAKKLVSPKRLIPDVGTPKEVLRTRISRIKEELERKDLVVLDWKKELQELEELHRNELRLTQTNELQLEARELIEENKQLKKSFEESESLYLNANKTVWEQSLKIKELEETLGVLRTLKEDLADAVKERDKFKETVATLKLEMTKKDEKIRLLENDVLDFDTRMELAMEKQKRTESYLRGNIDDLWGELAKYEGCTKSEVEARSNKVESLHNELDDIKIELDGRTKENDSLKRKFNKLEEDLKNSIIALNVEKESNCKLRDEMSELKKRNLSSITMRESFLFENGDCNGSEATVMSEEKSPLEQSMMNTTSTMVHNEVSRKLSETLQIVNESLLGGGVNLLERDVAIDPLELISIKEQLISLQEVLAIQGFASTPFCDTTEVKSCCVLSEINCGYMKEIDVLLLLEDISADYLRPVKSSPTTIKEDLSSIKYKLFEDKEIKPKIEHLNTDNFNCIESNIFDNSNNDEIFNEEEPHFSYVEGDVTVNLISYSPNRTGDYTSTALTLADELKMACMEETLYKSFRSSQGNCSEPQDSPRIQDAVTEPRKKSDSPTSDLCESRLKSFSCSQFLHKSPTSCKLSLEPQLSVLKEMGINTENVLCIDKETNTEESEPSMNPSNASVCLNSDAINLDIYRAEPFENLGSEKFGTDTDSSDIFSLRQRVHVQEELIERLEKELKERRDKEDCQENMVPEFALKESEGVCGVSESSDSIANLKTGEMFKMAIENECSEQNGDDSDVLSLEGELYAQKEPIESPDRNETEDPVKEYASEELKETSTYLKEEEANAALDLSKMAVSFKNDELNVATKVNENLERKEIEHLHVLKSKVEDQEKTIASLQEELNKRISREKELESLMTELSFKKDKEGITDIKEEKLNVAKSCDTNVNLNPLEIDLKINKTLEIRKKDHECTQSIINELHDKEKLLEVLEKELSERREKEKELESTITQLTAKSEADRADFKETKMLVDSSNSSLDLTNETDAEINNKSEPQNEDDDSNIFSLRCKIQDQEKLIEDLEEELNERRSKEEELESMITEFTLKEQEIEEKEAEIMEKERNIMEELEDKVHIICQLEKKIEEYEKKTEVSQSSVIEAQDDIDPILNSVLHDSEMEDKPIEKSQPIFSDDSNEIVQKDLEYFKNEITKVMKEIEQLTTEKSHLESQCSSLKVVLESKKAEMELLNLNKFSVESKTTKNEVLDFGNSSKCEELKSNIQELKCELEEKEVCIKLLQDKVREFEDEMLQMRKKLDEGQDLKEKFINLSNEFEQFKKCRDEENTEKELKLRIECLEEKVTEKESKLKSLSQNLEEYKNENKKQSDENDLVRAKLFNVESLLQTLDISNINDAELLLENIQSLNNQMKDKDVECQEMVLKLKNLEDLKLLEVSDLKTELEILSEQENMYKEDIEIKTKTIEELNININSLKDECKHYCKEMKSLEKIVKDQELKAEGDMNKCDSESQNDVHAVQALLEQKESENRKLNNDFENLKIMMEKITSENNQKDLNNQNEIENLQKCLETKESELAEALANVNNLKEQITRIEFNIQSSTNKNLQKDDKIKELENILDVRSSELDNSNRDRNDLEVKLNETKDSLASLQIAHDNVLTEKKRLTEKLSDKERELSEIKSESDALKADIDTLQQNGADLLEVLQETQTSLEEHLQLLNDKDGTIKKLEEELSVVKDTHLECEEREVKHTTEVDKFLNMIEKYEVELSEKDESYNKLLTDHKDIKFELEELRLQNENKSSEEMRIKKLLNLKEEQLLERERELKEMCEKRESVSSLLNKKENEFETVLSLKKNELEETVEKLNSLIREKNNSLKEISKERDLLLDDKEQIKLALKAAEEKIVTLEDVVALLKEEKNKLSSNLEKLKREKVTQIEKDFSGEDSELQNLDLFEENKKLLKDLESANEKLNAKIREYNSLSDEYDGAIIHFKTQIKDVENYAAEEISSRTKKISELEKIVKLLKNTDENLAVSFDKTQNLSLSKSMTTSSDSSCKVSIEALEEKNATLLKNLNGLKKEKVDLEKKLQKTSTKLDALQNSFHIDDNKNKPPSSSLEQVKEEKRSQFENNYSEEVSSLKKQNLELVRENEKLLKDLEMTQEKLNEKVTEYNSLSDEYDAAIVHFKTQIKDDEDYFAEELNLRTKKICELENIVKLFTNSNDKSTSYLDKTQNLPQSKSLTTSPDSSFKISGEVLDEKNLNVLKKETVDLEGKLQVSTTKHNALQHSLLEPKPSDLVKKTKKILLEENVKLYKQNSELEEEIETLRRRDGVIGSSEELNKQLEFMKIELNKMKFMNNKISTNYDYLKKEYAELENKHRRLVQEMTELKKHLSNENEKQDSSLSKKEFCELKRENNILKMRLEGLEGPLHKRVKLVESELAMEKEKSKKLMQELRRIQKEKASDDSMMILDSKPREERVNKEIGAGFGSKIVLDVEIMTLKNINYHLEKEIASLKEHVSHYKRKADEWKTRYYKEILMVNSKVNPSEVKDNTDEKNEPKQSSDLTTTRSATKQQTTDLQIDGNVTVMSAKDENRDFENHNATKNVHQVEANPVQTLPHKEKNYRPQTTIGVGKENQRSKYKKSKLSNVDDNNDCKTQ